MEGNHNESGPRWTWDESRHDYCYWDARNRCYKYHSGESIYAFDELSSGELNPQDDRPKSVGIKNSQESSFAYQPSYSCSTVAPQTKFYGAATSGPTSPLPAFALGPIMATHTPNSQIGALAISCYAAPSTDRENSAIAWIAVADNDKTERTISCSKASVFREISDPFGSGRYVFAVDKITQRSLSKEQAIKKVQIKISVYVKRKWQYALARLDTGADETCISLGKLQNWGLERDLRSCSHQIILGNQNVVPCRGKIKLWWEFNEGRWEHEFHAIENLSHDIVIGALDCQKTGLVVVPGSGGSLETTGFHVSEFVLESDAHYEPHLGLLQSTKTKEEKKELARKRDEKRAENQREREREMAEMEARFRNSVSASNGGLEEERSWTRGY